MARRRRRRRAVAPRAPRGGCGRALVASRGRGSSSRNGGMALASPVRYMEQRANVPSTSHGQPGARVMVVDDDADIANLIGEVLRDEGYVARVVSDSRTALDAFRDFQPD